MNFYYTIRILLLLVFMVIVFRFILWFRIFIHRRLVQLHIRLRIGLLWPNLTWGWVLLLQWPGPVKRRVAPVLQLIGVTEVFRSVGLCIIVHGAH